jgi:hypothetical protein
VADEADGDGVVVVVASHLLTLACCRWFPTLLSVSLSLKLRQPFSEASSSNLRSFRVVFYVVFHFFGLGFCTLFSAA